VSLTWPRHCGVNAAHKEEIMSYSPISEIRLAWSNSGLHGGVYYGLVCDKPAMNYGNR